MLKRMAFGVCAYLAICVIGLTCGSSHAQSNNNWLNSSGGNYNDDTNWSAGAPGGNEVFDLGSPGYTVNLATQTDLGTMTITNDNPTFSLNGNNMAVDAIVEGPLLTLNSGSLTFLGPGKFQNIGTSDSFMINGQLIINGATLSDTGADSELTLGSTASVTIENQGSLQGTIGQIGNLQMNNATLEFGEGGGLLVTANITNGSSITSNIDDVSISGPVQLDDSQFSCPATIIKSGGSLTMTDGSTLGSAVICDGSLTIISGSTNGGLGGSSFDGTLTIQLSSGMSPVITGFSAAAGGVLDFTLPNGFIPSLGEQFQVFGFKTGNKFTGQFSQVNLPALPNGESWNTSELFSSSGVLSVVPEPIGLSLIAIGGLLLRRRRCQ